MIMHSKYKFPNRKFSGVIFFFVNEYGDLLVVNLYSAVFFPTRWFKVQRNFLLGRISAFRKIDNLLQHSCPITLCGNQKLLGICQF